LKAARVILLSFSDDNKITIRLGRALKKGEYRVKVYQLLVNEQEVSNTLQSNVRSLLAVNENIECRDFMTSHFFLSL